MTITVGADPEFWLYSYEASTSPVIPSIGRVKGTKENPFNLGDGYFTHEDNVAIELGVPVSNGSSLGHIVQEGKKRIMDEFFNSNYDLYIKPVAKFTTEQLDNTQARSFGCEPDYDAYTNGKMRTVPSEILKGLRRYAGGHIHIGGNFNCPPFVSALFADIFISVCGQSMWPNPRTNNAAWARGEYYGRAGTFRPKPYGIEYRTPSNWWCANSKKGNYIGNQALKLGLFLENTSATNLREMIKKIDWLNVREIVNPTYGTLSTKLQEDAFNLIDDLNKVGVKV